MELILQVTHVTLVTDICHVPGCRADLGSRAISGYCLPHSKKWGIYRRRGVSEQRYQLLMAQDFCECCGAKAYPNELVTDHDHNHCGPKTWCDFCIRGRVCSPCNNRLAALDAPGWIKKGLRYLEFHKVTRPL